MAALVVLSGDRREALLAVDPRRGAKARDAAVALGQLGDQMGVRPLLHLLEDPYPNVQEAAYALVEENERARVHLGIGRLLLARAGGRLATGERGSTSVR